jgi:uncharacterized protein YoaH (UPF0181 family)
VVARGKQKPNPRAGEGRQGGGVIGAPQRKGDGVQQMSAVQNTKQNGMHQGMSSAQLVRVPAQDLNYRNTAINVAQAAAKKTQSRTL